MSVNTIFKNAVVPFTPEQMFALVNDVRAYPEFLPHCIDTCVIENYPNYMIASMTLKRAAISITLTTRNELIPYREIRLRLIDGPLSSLEGLWQFDAIGDCGCEVSLRLQFAMKSKWMHLATNALFESLANQLVGCIIQRAKKVYDE